MKEFYANVQYNKLKRRKTVALSVILVLLMLGCAATFVATKQYLFALVFASLIIIPIITLPSSFKNYPVTDKAIVSVSDDEIVISGEKYKIKDVTKVKVTIDIPVGRFEELNYQAIETLKAEKPSEEYFGSFDILVPDGKGKTKVAYSNLDKVICALEAMIERGLKNYTISYVIKKNTVNSEYDLRGDVLKEREEKIQETSKTSKIKQLI